MAPSTLVSPGPDVERRGGSARRAPLGRAAAVVLTGVLVLAACGSDTPSTAGPTVDGATSEGLLVSDVPRAIDELTHPDHPEPLVDPAELRSGGPPPDGIPPIDDPVYVTVDEVDFLTDREAVLALDIDGDARAYPLQIMTWHEIVNDEVGGVPVAVTYCPLCNSAVAYDRALDDGIVTFGTSGMLYNSALVMFDRQSGTLWSHFTGQAIIGALTGTELVTHPVALVSWAEWSSAHPDGLVLSRDTGFDRDYGRNPYPGYDDIDEPPFLFDGDADGRMPAKTRIVGISGDQDAVAVPLDRLFDERVVDIEVDGDPVVVWLVPGTASALEVSSVDAGRDVGTTGVFDRTVDGQLLDFEATDDGFVDAQTGTRWDVFGRAVEGELAGAALERRAHLDTFWFAWAAYLPDTVVAAS